MFIVKKKVTKAVSKPLLVLLFAIAPGKIDLIIVHNANTVIRVT